MNITSVDVAKFISILGLAIFLLFGGVYLISALEWMSQNHPTMLIVILIGIWLSAVFWYLLHTVKLMGPSRD